MAPLPASVVLLVILAGVLYLIALDFLEGPNFTAYNVYVVEFFQPRDSERSLQLARLRLLKGTRCPNSTKFSVQSISNRTRF